MQKLFLSKKIFNEQPFTLLENPDFKVTAFRYPSGVEALQLDNKRGHLVVLPFMGQIIWDAIFDGVSLKMKDMFSQPYPGTNIADTYGCFGFHSGLLANGTPGPKDTHPLHGEFPTSPMNESYLEITDDALRLVSTFEYVKGFGNHYQATPAVTLKKNDAHLTIEMLVENLSNYQPMPLQYMCHMNYAYAANAQMSDDLPHGTLKLRTSIPGHVHPTEKWTKYMKQLENSGEVIEKLDQPDYYDPEIVYMADHISQYQKDVTVKMQFDEHQAFVTKFATSDFDYLTRWILYNADQQVCAFALPGTCRPEGFLAAKESGSLIYLKPHESRHFKVVTGIESI